MKNFSTVVLSMLVVFFSLWVTVMLMTTGVHAAGGPWYVAPGGDDSNDCQSVATTCATINGALGKASPGETINVAAGTYTSTTGSEVVLIEKDITMSGGWNPSFTNQNGSSIIDGGSARRGLTVSSGVQAFVDHFTVESAGGDGRGISNQGSLTLSESLVQKNLTGIWSMGTLEVNNSAIVNNGNLQLCGGGIFTAGGSADFNNSTVSQNSTNPSACAPIAGIGNSGGTVALNNVTITKNVNGSLWSFPDDSATIQNTLIAGNTNVFKAEDCSESMQVQSLGYNVIGAAVCTIVTTVGDQVGTTAAPIDPVLGPLTGNIGYHPLKSGSPAINAGNPGGCMGSTGLLSADQRGAARVGVCDTGAYEFTVPGPAFSIAAIGGTAQRTPPFTSFELPFQVEVLDNLGTPVDNAAVTFTAPAAGASGIFEDSGSNTTIAETDESGRASAAAFIANGQNGSYIVSAAVGGVPSPAAFPVSHFGWYVSTSGNDLNNCQQPGAPCLTMEGPLNKAGYQDADTILVAGGTYTGSGNEVVFLNRDVRLIGGWNAAFNQQNSMTIVDGENARKGVYVDENTTVTIDRFTVQNGWATQGGGSQLVGGGIYNAGSLTLNNSLIFGNTAMYGGGLANGGGVSNHVGVPMRINNTTVSGNTAENGGGIYNEGNLRVHSSTISSNHSSSFPGGGGGLYNSGVGGAFNPPVVLTLSNSILAGNTTAGPTGQDCAGAAIDSLGYNLIGDTSGCTFNAVAGDLLNTYPFLSPLLINLGVHPLYPFSPAIDAGNPAGCTDHLGNLLLVDQRGIARVGRCDIGAYEFDPNNDPLNYIFLPLVIR